MNRRNNGYAARIMAAALATALLALAGCTGDAERREEPTDLVWPLPPEQPRIKYVASYRFREDVEEGLKTTSFADALLGRKEEKRFDSLEKPQGVHVDRDGRLFVTDTSLGRVVLFDWQNKKFALWGDSGNGVLTKPVGVTSDSAGRIYVTDVVQKRVVVFDKNGDFVLAMGKEGELESPTGIALDEGRRRVYVVDTRKHNIAVFDFDGNLVTTLGERGKEPGQFNFPTNLAVGADGTLYVSDSMNFRVQILDPDGNPLKAFGKNGRQIGTFSRAKGIAVDSDGHIYVVDSSFNNIQIFNREGQLLLFVGSGGNDAGQFWLPAGAYIDSEDRLYVADQFNFRIQVFQYLGEPEEQPAPVSVPPKIAPESSAQ